MKVAGSAYGLEVSGAAVPRLCATNAHAGLAPLSVLLETVPVVDDAYHLAEDRILLPMGNWHVSFERATREVLVQSDGVSDLERLVHPVLGVAGGVFARWDGRVALHAGAFAHDGRVWMILGAKERGKSSTLAALSRRGCPVLADDVVVVDGLDAFAGPRCVDLRPGVAAALGVQHEVVPVRGGQVTRLGLPQVPLRLPLGGWFLLDWGDEVHAQRLGGGERLTVLHENLTIALEPGDPATLLGVAELPAWRFRRPRMDLGEIDGVLDELLGVAAAAVA